MLFVKHTYECSSLEPRGLIKLKKNLKRNLRKLSQGKLRSVSGTFLVVSTYCSIPAIKKGKLKGGEKVRNVVSQPQLPGGEKEVIKGRE